VEDGGKSVNVIEIKTHDNQKYLPFLGHVRDVVIWWALVLVLVAVGNV
jgi:hypothetical protein